MARALGRRVSRAASPKRETLAYVTGADTPTGLITGRAMRGLPVRLRGLTTHPHAPGCASTVWDRLIPVNADADRQIDRLIELAGEAATQQRPLLFFAQDDLVQAASRRRDELATRFRFLLPEPDATELMLDKTLFHEWAGGHGYTVPQARVVANHEELVSAVGEAAFPAIIKPLVRMPEWDAAMNNRKVLALDSADDAQAIFQGRDLFTLCDRYLVQSWVGGEDEDVYFCLFAMDAQGRELDAVAGRKWMQWPPLTGSTAVCQAIDDKALLDYSREILQKAGLRGLGSIEYKRDPRDGHYYITEPTVGRNDHQSSMATLAGRNPTAALARHLLGKAAGSPRRRALPSALWIDELSTLRHCRSEHAWRRFGRLLRQSALNGLPELLLFDRRDPRPLLSAITSLSARRTSRARAALQTRVLERFWSEDSEPGEAARSGAVTESMPTAATAAPALRTYCLSEQDFLGMASEWQGLVARSSADPLFMSWAWLSAWWETWRDALALELFLVAVYRGTRLIGLAPLFRRTRSLRLGQNIQELHFLGNAWRIAPTVRTEYVDLIIDRNDQAAVLRALQGYLGRQRWDLLVVCDHVPATQGGALASLTDGLRLRRVPRQAEAGICLDTAARFDDWLHSLGRNTRLKAFNRRDYLARTGRTPRFVDEPNSELALGWLNDFHRARWGKPCFAGRSLAFHRRFLERLNPQQSVHFTRVELAGRTRSLLYDLYADGNMYNMQAGFEECVDRKVSMGTLHLGYAIERAFNDPASHRYDLLAGSGKNTFYKSHFNGATIRFGTAQYLRSNWLKHAWSVHDRVPRALSRNIVRWLDEPA